jgi:hypothetical protein
VEVDTVLSVPNDYWGAAFMVNLALDVDDPIYPGSMTCSARTLCLRWTKRSRSPMLRRPLATM